MSFSRTKTPNPKSIKPPKRGNTRRSRQNRSSRPRAARRLADRCATR